MQATISNWSLSTLLKKPELTGSEFEKAREEQIVTLATIAPLFLTIQVLAVSVVMLTFWGSAVDALLVLWGGSSLVATLVLAVGYRVLRSLVKRDMLGPDVDKQIQNAIMFLGLLWGVLPVLFAVFSDPVSLRSLGIIIIGTVFAGGFMLARMPRAASAFIWPVAIGVVFALQFEQNEHNELLSIVMLVQAAAVMFCIHINHRIFMFETRSRIRLKEQGQVISLLLRDFGESTSDWLWQTDSTGRIVRDPIGAENDASAQVDTMEGRVLVDLFQASESRMVLVRAIQRHQAFKDVVVRLCEDDEDGGAVWWSVTGKPVFQDGEFVGFRGVAADISRDKENESRIAYMAHFDGLTGLPNRMSFLTAVRETLEKGTGTGPTAVVLFDLDNFKWVNDTMGHPAGDELIRLVAERVSEICDENDHFARFGGDEFVVLAKRFDMRELEQWLDRLVETAQQPYSLWGSTVRCSASVGVRVVEVGEDEPDTLIKHADLALYQAKEKGRSRWEIFTDDLENRARERREIEDDLQLALAGDQLVAHFQPQIDARTGRLVSCEALLRWEHPTRGMVMPGAFITHAEDMGLIGQLGEWMIRQSLKDARRLPDDVNVAVNLSPLQIHSSTLMTTIINALAQTGIAPNRLELEITESVLMSDTEFTLDRLHQIRDLGVRIALDDFGTGYSSLSYLRLFPFDKIKIDQSFVRDLEDSADNRAITKATIDLAKSLRMGVTAEGVETEFQKQFLSDHGADLLQGYLISRPVPVDRLAEMFRLRDVEDAPAAEVVRIGKPQKATRTAQPVKGRAAKG